MNECLCFGTRQRIYVFLLAAARPCGHRCDCFGCTDIHLLPIQPMRKGYVLSPYCLYLASIFHKVQALACQ